MSQAFEKAFIAAQMAMKSAPKDALNPHFKSKYTDYHGLVEALKDPLHNAGLSFRHSSRLDNDRYLVGTFLVHAESGEHSETFEMPIPIAGNPQQIGSALTYARRYTLSSICGLASGEDDDANAASTPAPRPQPTQQTQAPRPVPASANKNYTITENQIKLIYGRAKAKGWTPVEASEFVGTKFGIKSFKDMTKTQLDHLLAAMDLGSFADVMAPIQPSASVDDTATFVEHDELNPPIPF